MVKEYAIWGTKKGVEDIIRINGQEVQNSINKANKIKTILQNRGEFERVRIQTINTDKMNIESDFINAIKRRRR